MIEVDIYVLEEFPDGTIYATDDGLFVLRGVNSCAAGQANRLSFQNLLPKAGLQDEPFLNTGVESVTFTLAPQEPQFTVYERGDLIALGEAVAAALAVVDQ